MRFRKLIIWIITFLFVTGFVKFTIVFIIDMGDAPFVIVSINESDWIRFINTDNY